jgi:tRNA-2-methylthio-N6-dimethylallyladenosine synthase
MISGEGPSAEGAIWRAAAFRLPFGEVAAYFPPHFQQMPTVFIKTYGCQMNERDSEAVAAQLVARGYSIAGEESGADVVLLNTCSVRDLAEQKALGKMQALVGQARKRETGQVFGYLGCMAQSRGAELTQGTDGVQLVVGTQKFHRTGEHLDALLAGRETVVVDTAEESGSQSRLADHPLPGAVSGRRQVSAFVSIMQGCNQHCTFCIVPFTRGGERSRTIPEIVAECRELVARGVREITLLGQIVTSYGRREYPPEGGRSGFVQLLDAVHAIEGLERIRFTSPHPKGYGEDLVEAYGRLPKLVESAHLPLQSGSDRILKAMHRGYTRDRFEAIIGRLRAVRPRMGITTDIIVGFPGETEEDFGETMSLCRAVEFDNAFVFKYSPRRDTPAATMAGALPEEIIEDRHRRLLDTINEIGKRRYEALVGRDMSILVEGISRRNPARYEGRTRCNKIVVFAGAPRHVGQVMDVRIDRVGTFTLYGDPAVVGLGERGVGLGESDVVVETASLKG